MEEFDHFINPLVGVRISHCIVELNLYKKGNDVCSGILYSLNTPLKKVHESIFDECMLSLCQPDEDGICTLDYKMLVFGEVSIDPSETNMKKFTDTVSKLESTISVFDDLLNNKNVEHSKVDSALSFLDYLSNRCIPD